MEDIVTLTNASPASLGGGERRKPCAETVANRLVVVRSRELEYNILT
jgi:hypothetical protein